jgi:biopolymer transport protein ExbB
MDFLQRSLGLWLDGGWTMIPLAVVAFMIYGAGVSLVMLFSKRDGDGLSDVEMRKLVENPSDAPPLLREILLYVQDGADTLAKIQDRFAEVVASKVPEADRRTQFLNVLVASAPLLGLLGTVLGMLTTFKAISMGGGKTVDMIAGGISEALITTEVGLLVALPGMVMVYLVKRKRDQYLAYLSRIEKITLEYHKPIIHGSTRIFRREDFEKKTIPIAQTDAGSGATGATKASP